MNMSETANGPQTEALNRHAKNEGQWDPDYDRLIDHCVLGSPKTAIVATRVSVTPVQPYLFRTYQCPPETPDPTETGLSPGNECRPTSLCCAYPGSSRNALWEAVRASSAAPYYFEEFQVGDDRYSSAFFFLFSLSLCVCVCVCENHEQNQDSIPIRQQSTLANCLISLYVIP